MRIKVYRLRARPLGPRPRYRDLWCVEYRWVTVEHPLYQEYFKTWVEAAGRAVEARDLFRSREAMNA